MLRWNRKVIMRRHNGEVLREMDDWVRHVLRKRTGELQIQYPFLGHGVGWRSDSGIKR